MSCSSSLARLAADAITGATSVAVRAAIGVMIGASLNAAPAPVGPATPVEQVAPVATAAQAAPPQQTPAFRGGVERVVVEATVVDKEGAPIGGLTAADFVLAVSGRPRPIASVAFVDFGPPATPDDAPRGNANANASAALPDVSTNVAADGAPPRAGARSVVLVVDTDSFAPGDERPVVTAAARFVRALRPEDRVGLLVMPRAGASLDLTRDRERVAAALEQVVGARPALEAPFGIALGLHESWLIIERSDREARRVATERECAPVRDDVPTCPEALERVARQQLQAARTVTDVKVRTLRDLFNALGATEGAKTVVLLSQGLAQIDGAKKDATDLAAAAGRSGINFYAIQTHASLGGMEIAGKMVDLGAEQQFLATTLMDATAASGGALLQPAGLVDGAFARIARELSARYLLSFDVEADDRASGRRTIAVTLRGRPGASVRHRREFDSRGPAAPGSSSTSTPTPSLASGVTDTGAPADAGTAADAVSALGAALASGRTYSQLPIAASTFTTPDDSPAGQRTQLWLRVGAAAERLASADMRFEVIDAKNIRVATAARPLSPVVGGRLEYTANMKLAPGRYVLRIAARDAAGRLGTLEHPFEARLATSANAPVAVGSLMLLDATAMAAGRTSVADIARGASVQAYLTLRALASFDWTTVQVALDVADAVTGGTLATLPMPLQAAPADGQARIAAAAVPMRDWSPGRYIARAVVRHQNRGGQSSGGEGTSIAMPTRAITLDASSAAAPSDSSAAGDTNDQAAKDQTASEQAAKAQAADAPIVSDDVNGLVQRAVAYAREYAASGASIVAEERYVQVARESGTGDDPRSLEWREDNDVRRRSPRDADARRQLLSDFLIVKTAAGGWTTYRDVEQVDGRPVRDRSRRAVDLFAKPGRELGASLARIATESARHNLGRFGNFNAPLLPLMVLQADQVGRFSFTRERDDRVEDVDVDVVAYRERQKPTFIKNARGASIFIAGRFWMAKGDGRILRTELTMQDPELRLDSTMTVAYAWNAALGRLMPVEMQERHIAAGLEMPRQQGRATYGNFRRFQVEVTENPPAPSEPSPASNGGSAAPIDLQTLVRRTTAYAQDYFAKGSSFVAEEHYVQISRPQPPPQPGWNVDPALDWRADQVTRMRDARDARVRRQLRSDLLMVKTTAGWTNYRDVAERDGEPVRQRDKRALDLFTTAGAALGPTLARVANESSRYNLGNNGNFNVPLLPLMALQPAHLDRFTFTQAGRDTIDGTPVAILAYRERRGPTFIRDLRQKELFITGKLWVAPEDGRVLRTEMGFVDRESGRESTVVVTYAPVAALGILMPAQMWERHTPLRIDYPYVEGRAVYSRFRRFDVQVREETATDR